MIRAVANFIVDALGLDPPPVVQQAGFDIWAQFDRDAERQESDHAFALSGVRPKYMEGPAGRLPYFKMADHLL